MNNEKETVLFPGTASSNPYHELLFKSLNRSNVNPIQKSMPIFLPFTRSVIDNSNIDTVHLDWLHYFYDGDKLSNNPIFNMAASFFRAVLFCIDILLIKLLDIQIVWTIHNKRPHKEKYAALEAVLNVFVANISDDITVKCHSAKRTIIKSHKIFSPPKVSVIPDGNYIDYYANNIDKDEARESLQINDEFVYLFFGSIRPYKGVLDLIDEFQSLSDDTNHELWIVGNPATDQIEHEVRNKSEEDNQVRLQLDFIPDNKVQYYLNAADTLVFPYKYILNSGSVHLGMSFAKPIITPRMGCIPETVPPENKLLYDSTDESGLREALIQAKSCDLTSIGQANYQQARNFDWDSVGDKYCEIYDSS